MFFLIECLDITYLVNENDMPKHNYEELHTVQQHNTGHKGHDHRVNSFPVDNIVYIQACSKAVPVTPNKMNSEHTN